MRPSPLCLVRVLPRSEVTNALSKLKPLPEPKRSDVPKLNIFQMLQKRKEAMGESYPPNLRIELALSKHDFRGVPLETKRQLREMIKEK
ncbi:hypothetical protein OBBRIDRAFT_538960 [Obba rivulosa]|uniref:Uncharacterized protein n=1 Tax=Obba rivulosa TaxID=1052685 RepID=A0A8E2DTM3_9APHY|nr:hypothetical protein OBBRIDRAFT_538960 [Obba rivulosa]